MQNTTSLNDSDNQTSNITYPIQLRHLQNSLNSAWDTLYSLALFIRNDADDEEVYKPFYDAFRSYIFYLDRTTNILSKNPQLKGDIILIPHLQSDNMMDIDSLTQLVEAIRETPNYDMSAIKEDISNLFPTYLQPKFENENLNLIPPKVEEV